MTEHNVSQASGFSQLDYEKVEREFETIREKVEYLLSIDPKSRNSDKRLFSQYLNHFTNYAIVNISSLFTKLNHFKITSFDLNLLKTNLKRIITTSLKIKPSDLPTFDSIGRVRRRIQNEEERFLPTSPEVAEKRNIRREVIEKYINIKLTK